MEIFTPQKLFNIINNRKSHHLKNDVLHRNNSRLKIQFISAVSIKLNKIFFHITIFDKSMMNIAILQNIQMCPFISRQIKIMGTYRVLCKC